MPRQKAKRNFPKGFIASDEEIRFGTPIEIAEYRASRLACNTILEIGCGVGFQTEYFAKHCKNVIAVEIDKDRLNKAKDNVKAKNVEFHAIDALNQDFISKLKDIDTIFCDPGRPASEEERKASSLSPTLEELRTAYKDISQNIAYECPPHLKDIPKEAELEFITLNGQLNRLMLYFNDLFQRPLSLIDLPSYERLEPQKLKKTNIKHTAYIGEINQAVTKAGVENALSHMGKLIKEPKVLILSDIPTISPFIRWYKITPHMKGSDVVLHYPIPEGVYKAEKKKFNLVKGKEPIHIFCIDDEFIPCVRWNQ